MCCRSAAFLQFAAFLIDAHHPGDCRITEEAPLTIQEVPRYTAKAGLVMTWLEEGIRVARVTDAAAVIPFLVLSTDT